MRRRDRLAAQAPAAGLGVVLLAAWQVGVPALGIPAIILPVPSQIGTALVDPAVNWPHHIGVTGLEVVTGFAAAVVLGVGLAVALVTSRWMARVLLPYILLAQIVPKIAFAPILFLILGYNQLPSVVITFLVAFFPMVVDTATGLDAVDPRMRDLLRSLGGSRWDVLVKAQFPTALPFVFSGLKVSSTLAVIGANVAEFVSARAGLGFLIINAQVTFNASLAFAAAAYLIAMGVVFYALIAALERWTMPWASGRAA